MSEVIEQLYVTSDSFDVPVWIVVVAWIAIIHGVIEFITFTAIFTLLPIKLVLVGKLKYKLAALLFLLLVLYIRIMYIPLLIRFLPLDLNVEVPYFLKEQSFYIVLISFGLFGIIPVICAFVTLFTQPFWRSRLKEKAAPARVSVIMPIYNEDINDLIAATRSVLNSDYDGELNLYCCFDDDEMSPIYLSLLKEYDIPLNRELPESVMIKVNGRELVISRFPHGGKRVAQGNGWKLVQQRTSRPDREHHHVLMIDSDVILDKNAVHNMSVFLSNDRKKKAVTGFISCFSSKWYNPLVLYQNPEYMQGQLVIRVMENLLGGVTCLPGALTMIHYKVIRRVGKVYFGDLNQKATLSYHRFYLGEDRYLTHLLMQNYDPYAIGMCTSAHASTRAVSGLKSFMKQRRRWLLGAVANEGWMIVSLELWQRVPLLLLWRLLEFCNRFMSALVFVFLLSYLFGYINNIYVLLFLIMPFLAQYAILIPYCFKFRLYSVLVTFPIIMLLIPFFFTGIYVYAIFTFFTRSWGGPRTSSKEQLGVNNADELYEEMMTGERRQSNHRFSNILRKISQRRKKYRDSQLGVANVIDEYTDEEVKGFTPAKRTNDNARAQPLPHTRQAFSKTLTRSKSILSDHSFISLSSEPQATLFDKIKSQQDSSEEDNEPLMKQPKTKPPRPQRSFANVTGKSFGNLSDVTSLSSVDEPLESMVKEKHQFKF